MTPGMQDYHRLRQWLEQQERRLAEVEAENRELKRQLSELRRGVGVSVVIQGRAIPVATEQATQTPHEEVFQQSQPGYPQRQATQPSQSPFPEDAWLTGHGPAARPVSPASPPAGLASRMRSHTPAPRVTPDWLSDGPDGGNPQNGRSTRQAQPQAPQAYPYQTREAPSDPRVPYASDSGTYRRPAPRHEATGSRNGIPTLAQITGAHPAAGTSRRQYRGANPYEDSFVLD